MWHNIYIIHWRWQNVLTLALHNFDHLCSFDDTHHRQPIFIIHVYIKHETITAVYQTITVSLLWKNLCVPYSGDRKAISRLAYEFCEDCSRQNIRYVEARYSPHLLANSTDEKPQYSAEQGDLTPREVVQLVNESFNRGAKNYNIKIKSILCCVRYRPG